MTTHQIPAVAASEPIAPWRVLPRFVLWARRTIIRIRVARTTDAVIRELVAIPGAPAPGRRPVTARLDELTARYEALGGNSSHLLR